jgi:hypothetical protein
LLNVVGISIQFFVWLFHWTKLRLFSKSCFFEPKRSLRRSFYRHLFSFSAKRTKAALGGAARIFPQRAAKGFAAPPSVAAPL